MILEKRRKKEKPLVVMKPRSRGYSMSLYTNFIIGDTNMLFSDRLALGYIVADKCRSLSISPDPFSVITILDGLKLLPDYKSLPDELKAAMESRKDSLKED